MKLSRFLTGLAPALALAALVGFGSAAQPSRADAARRLRPPRRALPAGRARRRCSAARRSAGRRRQAAAAGAPACAAAVAAVDATDKYAAVPAVPAVLTNCTPIRRRHRLDADLDGPRADDDRSRASASSTAAWSARRTSATP